MFFKMDYFNFNIFKFNFIGNGLEEKNPIFIVLYHHSVLNIIKKLIHLIGLDSECMLNWKRNWMKL